MQYISTRALAGDCPASAAILKGIASDGGLFVPEAFPHFDLDDIVNAAKQGYIQLAEFVLAGFLEEFTKEEIAGIAKAAYAEGFDDPNVAPLVGLKGTNAHMLELWHGPTLAFKDMALQMLPHLMEVSRAKTGLNERMLILVATSGDTGKAALEGFGGAEGTAICVYYPHDGVSMAQKLQMKTHGGDNVYVASVRGNFDDTQTAVKTVFADEACAKALLEKGFVLSSANSINWGRLLPQIVYYYYAYAQLVIGGRIALGDKVNFVVPTGNFGNILAAYYAHRCSMPVNKLVCASNSNKVLTDFFRSATYDAKRPFYKTMSPSMDILISSNLERLLFEAAGRNGKTVAEWMTQLKQDGSYSAQEILSGELSGLFASGCCDEEQTLAEMKSLFYNNDYLSDPHTAVAAHVYDEYVKRTGDMTETVIVSTASPFKFSSDVLCALTGNRDASADEFDVAEKLAEVSGATVPESILELRTKPELHEDVLGKDEIESSIMRFVGGLGA